MLDPSDNAINFLEETTGTVGTKKRETYSLYGGMSYSFSEKLSAGLRFDYIAADQAKYNAIMHALARILYRDLRKS